MRKITRYNRIYIFSALLFIFGNIELYINFTLERTFLIKLLDKKIFTYKIKILVILKILKIHLFDITNEENNKINKYYSFFSNYQN